MRRLLLCVIFTLWTAAPLWAQTISPTTLLADQITVSGTILTAQGNVSLWVNGQQITAQMIRYDQATNQLRIEGPIRLQDGADTVILAQQADLDLTLQRSILRDARLVLENRLQMAAAEIARPNARYTGLFKVAITSCYVCQGQTPIWQIRARRIVHDADERQIYLDGAQLRLFDIPIIYVPRMRLPDPSLDRATGFLVPELKNNSLTGFGIRLPYFIRIGDHRDLTLTPFIADDTTTLEYRYRQAFRAGNLVVTGAVSDDTIVPGELRAYLFANADFALARDYDLTFQLQSVTDPNYLREYGYSNVDRLHSFAQIERAKDRGYANLRLSHYNSLRASDNNAFLPSLVLEGSTERRYFPDRIGGEARYQLGFQSAYRYSDLDVSGFDVSRISGQVEWERNWLLQGGLVADFGVRARADLYRIDQHSGFPAEVFNTQAQMQASLSWPLQRVGPGFRDVFTPRLGFSLSRADLSNVPNQDSTRIELDEGNLFDFQRSPGFDVADTANLITLGAQWDRLYSDGTQMRWSLGRIWRDQAQSQFSQTSGLQGTSSDWLVSGGLHTTNGMDLLARALVDADTFDLQKAETRVDLTRDRYGINATYTYLAADLAENRAQTVSQLALNGRYKIDNHWTLLGNFRYDFGADEMSNAGLGVQFKNECIDVNFSVSRRFETNPGVRSSNDYGLTVELLGFGVEGETPSPRKTCGGSL